MAKEPDQDNPFEKLKDVEYDANSAIAAFTKMGLEEVKWISTGVPSFDALTMIPRGRVTQIQAPYATGKGQPVDSIIPMADGTTKRMGDINPGDHVIGWDGHPAEVLGVYDRGELPTYKVSISGGSSLEVDGDHLWMIRQENPSSPWEIVETRELAQKRHLWGSCLPIVASVAYDNGTLKEDPEYVARRFVDADTPASIFELWTVANLWSRYNFLNSVITSIGTVGVGGMIYVTITDKRKREQFCKIVYSLGGTITSTEHLKESPYVVFQLPYNPFMTEEEQSKYTPPEAISRRILSVTKTGETKKIRCIWVNGPKNLYVASEDYIVTHNTTLALNMVAGLRDKRVFYVDSEASLNPELLVALKLNPNNFTLYNKSAFLEDIYEEIKKAAESGMYDMIVFDSLASCTTKTEAEDNIANANIGQKAKMVNKMMRVLPILLAKNDTALVIINQEREVIGGYVPQKYTPGGMAVPYAASLMVALKTLKSWRFGRTTKDTQAGNFIGHYIEATIIKSKVNIPWRKSKFKLYYPQPRQESSDEVDS